MGARAYVELLDVDRIGFPAVRAECDFVAPLRFGDTAEVELAIARMGRTSITFRYHVFRAGEPRVLAAKGSVITAVVDLARFVAVPAPDKVTALLADLVDHAGA